MRLQSQQLEDKNRMLSEKDARNIAEMETLRQQLMEASPEEDKREVSEGGVTLVVLVSCSGS